MSDRSSQSPAPRSLSAGLRFVSRLRVPPSKSLTNRYLNLALLADRPVVLDHPLRAADTDGFCEALSVLGFDLRRRGERLWIAPPEQGPAAARIDCGASGTMARFLAAALTTRRGHWRLDGRDRLRQRPLGPLLAGLRQLGGDLRCEGRDGFLPLVIRGGTLSGGSIRLDAGRSSQFLSAVLMAAVAARGEVEVRVSSLISAPYVELTLAALSAWGVAVERREPGSYRVVPGVLEPTTVTVPGDDSAAAYPAAAAALTGGEARLLGLERHSRQGDRRFLDLLARMGATVSWRGSELSVGGGGSLHSVDADLSELPDQVPTLAALAPFAHGTTRIRNVAHLRLKESDRLEALRVGLRRAGAEVEVSASGLTVPGVWADTRPPTRPVVIDSFRDHRIAMSFALLGLRRPGVSIADPGVVEKSYPGFWRDLEAGLRP